MSTGGLSIRLHGVHKQIYEYLRPFKEGTATPTVPLGQERCETRLLASFCDV